MTEVQSEYMTFLIRLIQLITNQHEHCGLCGTTQACVIVTMKQRIATHNIGIGLDSATTNENIFFVPGTIESD